jgi:hypothetical protein
MIKMEITFASKANRGLRHKPGELSEMFAKAHS